MGLFFVTLTAAMEPLVAPAIGEHKGTWIFLHGLGDTGNGWFYELKAIQRELPHVRIVCPTAPVSPVTLNGGMSMTSWHDLVSLNNISEQHFLGIDKTTQIVNRLIDEEAAVVGSENVVLGGFSQGAAMTMYVGLQYPKPLAGLVALSGYLPFYDKFEAEKLNEANKNTPLFQGHGDVDNVVDLRAGVLAHETIEKFNENAVMKVYPGLAHGSSRAEMKAVFDFVSERLSN